MAVGKGSIKRVIKANEEGLKEDKNKNAVKPAKEKKVKKNNTGYVRFGEELPVHLL